jgi:hypothetical protein
MIQIVFEAFFWGGSLTVHPVNHNQKGGLYEGTER